MHVGLISGLLVLLALGWLVLNFQRRRHERRTPADMLLDELNLRRSTQEGNRRARERLEELKRARLRPVVEGVLEMIRALPGEGCGRLRLRDEERRALLEVPIVPKGYGERGEGIGQEGQTETLTLEWDIRDFDLGFFAGADSLEGASGDYFLRLPDGSLIREAEFTVFMRRLSALLADRLA
ncbi:MAG: hypothetical protein FWG17_02075 [Desulfovibrionaceae bacterium]|nr:hypothetical protein [Desulfovibrionaceae bacterium]